MIPEFVLPWERATAAPDALGESPFWHPEERALYWVDIPGRALRRLGAEGDEATWPLPAEPGCVAPLRGGGGIVALRDGVWRFDAWAGPLQRIAPAPYDPVTQRFNDGKADPAGRFWAGTLYEPKDASPAALFSFDLRERPVQAVRRAGDAITSNGLAWSPDGRTMYWADTQRHAVTAWDWDAATGTPSHPRPFLQFPGKPHGWQAGDGGYGGRPDGAAVDAEGCYWVAMYEGGRLLRVSPEGELLCELPVPVQCPTMPCFGGPDLRTLYVTSARQKRPEPELEAMPWSGHVLVARVEVPGLPTNFVTG